MCALSVLCGVNVVGSKDSAEKRAEVAHTFECQSEALAEWALKKGGQTTTSARGVGGKGCGGSSPPALCKRAPDTLKRHCGEVEKMRVGVALLGGRGGSYTKGLWQILQFNPNEKARALAWVDCKSLPRP
jgi:hypothetical protein